VRVLADENVPRPLIDRLIAAGHDMETMVERARRRDVAWVGSAEVVEVRCRQHWIPTPDLYERLTAPHTFAHAIIDNRNPHEPKILRLTPP
jgi:hypothetical protein